MDYSLGNESCDWPWKPARQNASDLMEDRVPDSSVEMAFGRGLEIWRVFALDDITIHCHRRPSRLAGMGY